MINKKELAGILSGIEGFLTLEEGKLLFDLAKNTKTDSIVEIGSWKGKSTVCLGLGSKEGSGIKIYAIDPHTGSLEHQNEFKGNVWTFDIFKENVRRSGIEDMIVPIVKPSGEAVKDFNQEVSLIFIDGAHEYDAVKKDFEDWISKIVDGGVVAFHDTIGWAGPRKVVEEYLYKSNNFINIGFVDSITYGTKVSNNNLLDRIKNRYILCLRDFSEYVRPLPIPKVIKKTGKKILNIFT